MTATEQHTATQTVHTLDHYYGTMTADSSLGIGPCIVTIDYIATPAKRGYYSTRFNGTHRFGFCGIAADAGAIARVIDMQRPTYVIRHTP